MKTPMERAWEAWNSCEELRSRRERYKRFTYGRQWDDPIKDPDTGRVTTEREILSRDGRPPLTNNMIRQLVKCVVGRFRVYRSKVANDSSNPTILRRLARIQLENELDELDCRLLEEFLISGTAIQRLGRLPGHDPESPTVNNVALSRFFLTLPRDPRGRDIRLAGMLHDMSCDEVVAEFGTGSKRYASELMSKVGSMVSMSPVGSSTGAPGEYDFHYSGEYGKVRVIEVWESRLTEILRCHDRADGSYRECRLEEQEIIERENTRRLKEGQPTIRTRLVNERRWYGTWLLGDGTVLREELRCSGDESPFVIKFYPVVDGEVHSLVEDVIDQQKYVNRLVNLIDRIMASSAKGALLFPVDCLAEGMELTHVAKAWSATDGIIPYKFRPGDEPPRQLNPSVGDIGAKDLLKLEMQMFHDVSGVGEVLLGQTPDSRTGAARYAAQVENATVAIRDLMDTFLSFLHRRDRRLIKEMI